MNTSALIMMLLTEITVVSFTGYFFFKVLTTPPKPEVESYSEEPGDVTHTPFEE